MIGTAKTHDTVVSKGMAIQWHWIAVISMLMLTTPFQAFAQEVEDVEVVVTGCQKGEFRTLHHLINVETSASFPEVIKWMREHHPIIQVKCNDNTIDIRLENQDRTVLNRIKIDRREAIARDMPRFVALASMELVASNTLASKESQVKIFQRSFELLSPTRSRTLSWSLGPIGHGGGQPFKMTFGGAFYGELSLPTALCFAADTRFTMGREMVALGSIHQTLWSGSVALLIRFKVLRLSVRPGLGFRAGKVFWKGEAQNADNFSYNKSAPWGGPFLALRSSGYLSGKTELSFHLETGYTVFEAGALVDEKSELSLSGMWVAFFIGIGGVHFF